MPTKKRKARERELAAERAEQDRQFSVEVPEYALGKIGSPSELRDALSIKGSAYGWNGVRFYDETDEPHRNAMPDDLGANVERQEQARKEAEELRRKHPECWNIRGGAKKIAAAEGIGLSTVYAHKKRLRRQK
jgi:hypothetical protein